MIPKVLRERYHLGPGTQLEIESRADEMALRVAGTRPALIRKRGLLVHHGPETIPLDVADFIRRQRQSRVHAKAPSPSGNSDESRPAE